MSDKKCVHVIVEGRVQGVFFRAYTKEEADKLGLTGWVRNLTDGSVEALVEGETEAVDRMLYWFHQGSPGSKVLDVKVQDVPSACDSSSFEIHYY
jgi:acylphosphatase